jgi:hypothetical protein
MMRGAVPSGERHHQVADGIDGHIKIHRQGRGAHDVVRSLLAGPITVAHNAASVAGGLRKAGEQRRCQLQVGLESFANHGDKVW